VSVIIPAKDEALYIEESLRSILASDYPRLELIVADDRSRDRTPQIVSRISEEDSRVSMVTIRQLPAGWTGKTHALFQAANKASGDIFLFTDADTVFAPDVVSRAVDFLGSRNLDMISLLPGFTKSGFSENVVHPHLQLGFTYFHPLYEVNDHSASTGMASGCFIMIRREVYEEMGTWERFQEQITEDVALGKAVKAAGKRLNVLRGGDLVRTRPFERISVACRFWKRAFYGGLDKSVPKIARLLANYVILSLLCLLFIFSWMLLMVGTVSTASVALFTASLLAMAAVIVPFSFFLKADERPWVYGMTAPLGLVISAGVMLSTLMAVLTDKGIRWRGSSYK